MKLLYTGLAMVLLATVGCQVPTEPQATPDQPGALSNGTLSFTSFEDYDAFLNQPSEDIEAFFASQSLAGFVSYADAHLTEDFELAEKMGEAPLVDSHVFSRLLNEDGVIKIGAWYCRVNAPEEKVYVLHADHYHQHYADLVNQNTDYPKLLVFSTETEVLEELQGLSGTSSMAGRGELYCDGAGPNNDSDNDRVAGTAEVYTHDTFLRYIRYGIYFELDHQVKWRHRTNNILNKWAPIDAWNVYTVYQREYEVKCGKAPGREWNDIPLQTAWVYASKNSYHYNIYHGTRKLSQYRVQVQTFFRVPLSDVSSDYIDASTRTMNIQHD